MGQVARPEDLDLTLTALLVHKSTNIGMEPVVKPGERALTRGRLTSADHGYFHLPGLRAASELLVGAQSGIGITEDWAAATSRRPTDALTVPVAPIHTRPNPKYFSTGRGMTWLNVVDRFMGLGGIVMPGTLRDSLCILDAVFNLDGPVRPEIVITDTGSDSDLVFGLFAICGYQFSPRIADISDAGCGASTPPPLRSAEPVARHTIRPQRIRAHWPDMLARRGIPDHRPGARPLPDPDDLPRRPADRTR